MLALTTKVRYATRLMLRLAYSYAKDPVLLKTIAEQEEISQGYLGQILPMLKTAKLIRATRGAYGGYFLAKSPYEITIKDIVEALEGPIAIVECVNNVQFCPRCKTCVARKVWCKLKARMVQTLEQITLGCLINDELEELED